MYMQYIYIYIYKNTCIYTYSYVDIYMYIYTYISQFHKRGVIAEWVKAASDNQEVMSSNTVMYVFSRF